MSPAGPAPTMPTCVRTPQNRYGCVPLWTPTERRSMNSSLTAVSGPPCAPHARLAVSLPRDICMQPYTSPGRNGAPLAYGETMLYTCRDDGRMRHYASLVAVPRLVAGLTQGGTS